MNRGLVQNSELLLYIVVVIHSKQILWKKSKSFVVIEGHILSSSTKVIKLEGQCHEGKMNPFTIPEKKIVSYASWINKVIQ